MAFCANCGSQVQGAFCPNCGTSMASASGSGGQGAAAAPAQTPVTSTGGIEPHVAATLCYAFGWIACIIFLVLVPFNQNKFIRFHAFQSLFLQLATAAILIGLLILQGIMTAVLHAFGLLFLAAWPLAWVGIICTFLFMMYKAFNNQTVKLPIIGDLAEKQA